MIGSRGSRKTWGGGRDFIDINGKPPHNVSYLNNFLFDAARLRTPVVAFVRRRTKPFDTR
ncbi:MAG: hypothetical protein IPN27_09890 [Cellvibrionales bacterium]|nr:hypothetical protein [Cellvibrionales bacterium]